MVVPAGQLDDQLRALRDELCVAPDPDVKAAHLAAMDLAMDLEWVPDESERSTVRALPARRRRMGAFALPVAATLGVLGLTCGLAAAGSLPGPAQRQAARVAGAVGWEIPGHSGSSGPTQEPGAGRRRLDPTTSTSGSGADEPGTVPSPTGSSGAGRAHAPSPAAGSSGTAPGSSGTAPGHTGGGSPAVAPGKSGAAPGQTGSTPGQSGTAPGKSGDAPGKSGTAPGQTGTSPGKSGDAPGHNKDPVDG